MKSLKQELLVGTVLFLILTIGAADCGLLNFADANPFSQNTYGGQTTIAAAKPPAVTIFSPKKDTTCTNKVILHFNVSVKGSKTLTLGEMHYASEISIHEIYYLADWQENKTEIFRSPTMSDWNNWQNKTPTFFFMGNTYDPYNKHDKLPNYDFENFSLTLTNIPEGTHNITLVAVGSGSEYQVLRTYQFFATTRAKVEFTIDNTPPRIAFLSPENKSYLTSEILLNFTVNESTSKLSYILDGNQSQTVTENITLTGLPAGMHNVTVYATDLVGNSGVSETIDFAVESPEIPPSITTLAGSVVLIAVIIPASIFLYSKNRQHRRKKRF
jgi:hypothetical protein